MIFNALTHPLVAAVESAPAAGGAALDQVVIATAGAMIVTAGLLVIGIGYRRGTLPVVGGLVATAVGRVVAFSERASGLPGWAAIPSAVVAASLIIALFGMMWDISLHIDEGRDEGPLANPAHYFILAGLFGVFAAGFLAMVLPKGKPSATAVRITGDWYAPLGGIMVAACGAFSLTGFPLDDVWHRIFGQDVTLWGPTHLMLLGGAAMALVGQAVLLVEASRAESVGEHGERPWVMRLRRVALAGGLLIGLSIFQAEFDFGVPQFRFVFGPMLVAFAAGVALVATRIWLGRGSALAAVAFFLVVRGTVSLLVGPVLGETTPALPLYVAEALVVELVALRVPRERTLAFAAWAGLGIGTVGLAAEYAWSRLVMPIPWSPELLPEAAALAIPIAVAAALVGAWLGAHLASDRLARTAQMRAAALVGGIAIFALVAFTLQKPAQEGVRVAGQLQEATPAPERTVTGTFRFDPSSATDGAEFANVTAWQGGGLEVAELEKVADGVYRTSEPIPAYGDWKSLLRVSRGDTLSSIPIYLPADPAIPAPGVPATASFERTMVADHEILQRESTGAAGWLTAFAYLSVLAITLGFIALLVWGLHRLAVNGRAEQQRGEPSPQRRRPVGRPVVAR
jgi:hypothetical protein